MAGYVWFVNLRPLYGLLCAFLRFVLGGENRLREQYRRKDTIKAAKILGFLLDSSQILDVKFRRDQGLKHLMVTKSSIRTGSGIDYPKVEPEPIKSHHKILTRNDRIPSHFAGRCRLRRSDVAKRTSDLLFEFFMRSSSKF